MSAAADPDAADVVAAAAPPAAPPPGPGARGPTAVRPLASRTGSRVTGGDDRVGALPAGLTRDELVAAVGHASADVPHGAGLLVAVSGGPDSTAMAHLLSIARPDLELELVHVRHGLRDDAADAATAAAHAVALECRYHEQHVDVRVGRLGPEAAAREARYGALVDRARTAGVRWVAVGHTADDQAETVLLNLVRGSGLRGVGGMRPQRDHGAVRLLRPLLRIRRADVAAFIAGEGLLAVADPTNHDPDQRRARARREALPVLDRLAGGTGDVVGALNRMAELARIDTEALDVMASAESVELVVVWGRTRAVRLDLLRGLPRALSTRVLRSVAADVGAGELGAAAVSRVVALEPGEALHVTNGVLVSCGGGWLGFAPPDHPPLRPQVLAIPGTTRLPQLGLTVHVEWPWPLAPSEDPAQLDLLPPEPLTVADVVDDEPSGPLATPPPGPGPRARMWAVFDDRVTRSLIRGVDFAVRPRRNGDRLRSRAGMRKLQDLMVDAHVPRVCRDLVPVIVDEHDQPLWVPGVAQRAGADDAPAGVRMWLA